MLEKKKEKENAAISWLHAAQMKDIPGSHVSATEHHLAGMHSQPLNYQQLLNNKQ